MNDKAASVVQRPGVRAQFPSVKRFLARYAVTVDAEEARQSLQRYAHEGCFPTAVELFGRVEPKIYGDTSAQLHLQHLAGVYRWRATHAALGGRTGWQPDWQRAAAYEYWAMRADFAFQARVDEMRRAEQPPRSAQLLHLSYVGGHIGDLAALGWLERAVELASLVRHWLARDGFNDGGDDYGCRRTQHFVLRLMSSWQRWAEQTGPRCAFDEPVFNALIEHWHTRDAALIEHLLLAACDRHTHQARPDRGSRRVWFDLSTGDWDYDPFEVLAVMRLREQAGLAIPELDHPLMATPLAALPGRTAPYTDELLEAVVRRLQADLGGYWDVRRD